MVQPLQVEPSLWEVLKTQGIRVPITWSRFPFPQVEQMFQGPFLPGLFCDIVLSKHGRVQSRHPVCSLFGEEYRFPQVYLLYGNESSVIVNVISKSKYEDGSSVLGTPLVTEFISIHNSDLTVLKFGAQ